MKNSDRLVEILSIAYGLTGDAKALAKIEHHAAFIYAELESVKPSKSIKALSERYADRYPPQL